MGKVNLPYTAMGIAMHRDNAIIGAIPRDGGSLVRIDDTGKVDTIVDKNKLLPHPVRVALPANSDSVMVGDDIAKTLVTTTAHGTNPSKYKDTGMKITALAVTNGVVKGVDRVLYDNENQVAADPTSTRWASAHAPDTIYVKDDSAKILKTLKLPAGKVLYKGGLMSWTGVGTLCVACQDTQGGSVWLLMYDVEKDKIRSLFPWNNGTLQSFVVGPRMRWDRRQPSPYKSVY